MVSFLRVACFAGQDTAVAEAGLMTLQERQHGLNVSSDGVAAAC